MKLEPLIDAVVTHGPLLLVGASALLLLGCFLMACQRDPAQRRRHGVATSLALLVYLIVGSVPMPRWLGDRELVQRQFALQPAVDAEVRAALLQQELTRLGDDAPSSPAQQRAALASVATAETTVATAPAAIPLAPPTLPWSRWLSIVYLLLAALTTLRCSFGLLRLRWLLVRSAPLPAPARDGLDLPTGLRIRTVRADIRPFCAGLLRPTIVVPHALLQPERRDELRAVLQHEAAHVRAGDTRLQALLAVLSVPLAWHPLFWLLRRDVRFCSEVLADDRAAPPERRTAYARALLQLAEQSHGDRALAGTVAIFHRPSDFYRRIQMLLQRTGSLSTSTTRGRRALHTFAMACLVTGTAALFGVPASAQEPTRASRAMQEENRALRAEIDAMRNELMQLRDLAESLRPQSDPTQSPAPSTSAFHELLYGMAKTSPQPLTDKGAAGDELLAPFPDPQHRTERKAQAEVAEIQSMLAQIAATPDTSASRIRQLLLEQAMYSREAGKAESSPEPTPIVDPREEAYQRSTAALPPRPSIQTPSPLPPTSSSATEAIADLTSRYLDLQDELEAATDEAAELKQLAEAGQAPSRDARRAAMKVKTLTRKRAVVQDLIHGEIGATEAELAWLDAQHKDAGGTDSLRLDMQRLRAKMRLKALHSVR